jgi:phosphoribosylaminoimidazolecarboxamide formyltransferase/IMP cyclohydrolase
VGEFIGSLSEIITQLSGKALSYNNLLDIDSAIHLLHDLTLLDRDAYWFAIFKHTNPCGVAKGASVLSAFERALASDPISAFGGVLITNQTVDLPLAERLQDFFYEILIAPAFEREALNQLKRNPKRILLQYHSLSLPKWEERSVLNGKLRQTKNVHITHLNQYQFVTDCKPTDLELEEAAFAEVIVKHMKSNAIAIVKAHQLIGSGMGQPSRVDAVHLAIEKAKRFGFSCEGAILASDAFFPFADAVKAAYEAGIRTVIQPGGSIRDQETIAFCNAHQMKMIFTGFRHFKH